MCRLRADRLNQPESYGSLESVTVDVAPDLEGSGLRAAGKVEVDVVRVLDLDRQKAQQAQGAIELATPAKVLAGAGMKEPELVRAARSRIQCDGNEVGQRGLFIGSGNEFLWPAEQAGHFAAMNGIVKVCPERRHLDRQFNERCHVAFENAACVLRGVEGDGCMHDRPPHS
ncbi:MAG: hypothetical protein OEL88_11200 [Sterolibacteriaceae bacterium MAG5]|nr:hypothetical protein [Candidatus Nitricoxidireducens bremensis]